MKRRDFFKLAMAVPVMSALPSALLRAAPVSRKPLDGGRVFELTYEVEIPAAVGKTRLWIPLPDNMDTAFERGMGSRFEGNATVAELRSDPVYGAAMFYGEWPAGTEARKVSVTTRVSTRNRTLAMADTDRNARLYLEPTPTMPVDGLVRTTALEITKNCKTDLDKARTVYDWICDNTFRDPAVAGCGTGNITYMLETGHFGGKCADLNSLFAGLLRAVGIPAREMYGVRVADSANFKSLGRAGDISKAQHCRAEFYIEGKGWIAADPADVRKAVLEEKLAIDDPKIKALRDYLFGSWEMNWVGFNTARDFELAPRASRTRTFLMYPYAETDTGVLNDLDPAKFSYKITSKEITG